MPDRDLRSDAGRPPATIGADFLVFFGPVSLLITEERKRARRYPLLIRGGSFCRALLELLNYLVEIWIAGAETSGEPVATAFGDSLAIGKHIKLTGAAGRNHGIHAEPLLDRGHETRDLGCVIPSSGAGTDLDFHSVILPTRQEGHTQKPYH